MKSQVYVKQSFCFLLKREIPVNLSDCNQGVPFDLDVGFLTLDIFKTKKKRTLTLRTSTEGQTFLI